MDKNKVKERMDAVQIEYGVKSTDLLRLKNDIELAKGKEKSLEDYLLSLRAKFEILEECYKLCEEEVKMCCSKNES